MNYTQEQLEAAFQKVQNKEHWKNPINAYIKKDEQAITYAAIVHFTATEPNFYRTDSNPINGEESDFVRVLAKGYRLGPAN
jgi:hypothetical protein